MSRKESLRTLRLITNFGNNSVFRNGITRVKKGCNALKLGNAGSLPVGRAPATVPLYRIETPSLVSQVPVHGQQFAKRFWR